MLIVLPFHWIGSCVALVKDAIVPVQNALIAPRRSSDQPTSPPRSASHNHDPIDNRPSPRCTMPRGSALPLGSLGGPSMIVGVPRESFPGERRVALVPAALANLSKIGLEVIVESGAGVEAGYPDADYADKGAKIISDRAEIFRTADIVVQVLSPTARTTKPARPISLCFVAIKSSSAFFRPMGSVDVLEDLAQRGVTSFSVELMPRITRAQSMDALSSMGDRSRLQSRARRRRPASPHLPRCSRPPPEPSLPRACW